MEETVNLADLESAEIFGGEVMFIVISMNMRTEMEMLTLDLR